MLAFFKRLLSFRSKNPIARVAAKVADPWAGSGGMYVGAYRRPIEAICEQLETLEREGPSPKDVVFGCRFLSSEKAAEVYECLHGVVVSRLALVKVHGSECAPYEAIVIGALSKEEQEVFDKNLPTRVVFQAA